MKLVNHTTEVGTDRLLAVLSASEDVNRGVKFDEKRGRPVMLVKNKGNRLRITCRYVGGASKDNGFLVGTFFFGSIRESEHGTRIRGVITTAPLYHTLLVALIAFFVYRCIALGGINPIPIILAVFSFIMFKPEFEKQGSIARYIPRAIRYAEERE